MRNPTQFTRKGRTIKKLDTGEVVKHESINKAKHESWKLQANGTELGYGTVQRLR